MDVKAKMKAVLDGLAFDFSNFTMDGFVSWLQERTAREIEFIFWEMPPGLFGVWLSGPELGTEYIFVDKSAAPLHKVHIQLHELSHIICGHTTITLNKSSLQKLLIDFAENDHSSYSALFRSFSNEQQEQEAELLAALIQQRVIRHKRIQQLSIAASSDSELATHFKSLKLV